MGTDWQSTSIALTVKTSLSISLNGYGGGFSSTSETEISSSTIFSPCSSCGASSCTSSAFAAWIRVRLCWPTKRPRNWSTLSANSSFNAGNSAKLKSYPHQKNTFLGNSYYSLKFNP